MPDEPVALATAVWRTWGGRGIVRRGGYEVLKRSGRLRRLEGRWPAACEPGAQVRSAGITPTAAPGSDPGGGPPLGPAIELYGALTLDTAVPPDWHRHPFTGHDFDPSVHWSELSDASPEAGDIKDVWELARFGWLQRALARWAASSNDAIAEAIWLVIEDWHGRNPRFCGPHWMCGQETSLRTIATMFLADALRSSPTSTPERQTLVAQMVHDAVGRVQPTLGYALSQRNNHASSEAGFLWSAAVLAPWLPNAKRLRERASVALTEVVTDQFAADGSYAQHSPTYQRVALHVLLWCLAVEQATGTPAPAGVAAAVGRSVPFLRSLVAPESGGRVPNLGGNDGALVFDLVDGPIGDLRPVIAHAAAATGQPSGFGPGPWDGEAAWFGRSPCFGDAAPVPASLVTHPLTVGRAHAVVRAGALDHRPAHGDQLHVDVWLHGHAVAVDPGSYRYTAPPPWGNALAGEDVHNLPRHRASPQAQRSGRFFWRSWQEGAVRRRMVSSSARALVVDLTLPVGTRLVRMVAVGPDVVVVVDEVHEASGDGAASIEVGWNLRADSLTVDADRLVAEGPGWSALVVPGSADSSAAPSIDAPTSGWEAVTYGVLEPLHRVTVRPGPDGRVVSVFAAGDAAACIRTVAARAAELDVASAGIDDVEALLSVLG